MLDAKDKEELVMTCIEEIEESDAHEANKHITSMGIAKAFQRSKEGVSSEAPARRCFTWAWSIGMVATKAKLGEKKLRFVE